MYPLIYKKFKKQILFGLVPLIVIVLLLFSFYMRTTNLEHLIENKPIVAVNMLRTVFPGNNNYFNGISDGLFTLDSTAIQEISCSVSESFYSKIDLKKASQNEETDWNDGLTIMYLDIRYAISPQNFASLSLGCTSDGEMEINGNPYSLTPLGKKGTSRFCKKLEQLFVSQIGDTRWRYQIYSSDITLKKTSAHFV